MAWRKQPYYDQLHPWARNNFDKEIYVLVFVNDEATLIPSRKGRTSVRKDNGPGFATYKVQVTPGVPFGGVGWQLSPLVPRCSVEAFRSARRA